MSQDVIENQKGSNRLSNIRWEAFCVHYTGGYRRNAAASYIAAGYKPKDANIANASALKLLGNTSIENRIQYLNDEALKIERLHARDAIKRLALIATAKLSDYMDENGRIDPRKVADTELSGAVQEMTMDDTESGVKIKIKLKDDMKALELLGLVEKNAPESTQNNVFIIET